MTQRQVHLENRIAELERENSDLASQLEYMTGVRIDLEIEVTANRREIRDLEAKVGHLEDQIADMAADAREVRSSAY